MVESLGYWFSLTLLNLPAVFVLIFALVCWFWDKIYIRTDIGYSELPRWLVSSHNLIEHVTDKHPLPMIAYMLLAGSLQVGVIISSAFDRSKTYVSLMSQIAGDIAPHAWIIGIPLGLWGVVTLISEFTIISIRLSRKLNKGND